MILEDGTIRWKLYLRTNPSKVYKFLTTDRGRSTFWAEKTTEKENQVQFEFPNGYTWTGKILERVQNEKFVIEYIDSSEVTFNLKEHNNGTILQLIDRGVDEKYLCEVNAGWGSVLMALKGAVDYNIDLRNHNSEMTWDEGFFNN